MSRKHYHLTINQPGTLPTHEPMIFTSLQQAYDAMKEEADALRGAGLTVKGSRSKGYSAVDKESIAQIPWVIQLNECDEDDCLGGERDSWR